LNIIGSPHQLALLRIVVPLLIVRSPELYRAPELAAHPERWVAIPEGLGLLAQLPLSFGAVSVLQLIAQSSAATAALGLFSRASMAALTVSAGILFSFSSREGAVLHDMHLFWLTALLAVSPCGAAWAIDARKKPAPGPSPAFGAPLAFARLFLGLVYFFPGVHKLWDSGLAWASGENVIGHLHAKWLQVGQVPAFRIDHYPWLITVGAVGVLAFELCFVFLAQARHTRMVALVAGLLFHFVTAQLFFIPFVSLWGCYGVLLPDSWFPRSASEEARPESFATRAAPVALGAAVVVCLLVQGVRGQVQAWPFACYPTFSHLMPQVAPEVVVEVELRDGATQRLTGRERRLRSQAEWGHLYRISGAYGDAPNRAALEQHGRAVIARAQIDRERIVALRLYRVNMPSAPERWSEAPAGGTLLLETGSGL
jgi:hypothetical protein